MSTGLCGCGCGRTTTIATITSRRDGAVKGQPRSFLRGHCVRGAAHWQWKNGRSVSNGYVQLRQPGHPRAHKGTGYVFEHILVVERALGHYLRRSAPVHHVDENKANNANRNLVACQDDKYHRLLHARARAFAACGDANAQRCRLCSSYADQADIRTVRGKPSAAYHRRCAAEYQRTRAAAAGGRC